MELRFIVPLALIAAIALSCVVRFFKRRKLRLKLEARWLSDAPELDREILDDIAAYHRARREAAPGALWVDDATWNDLDMDQLFSRLNRTVSVAGGEVLYDMLRDTGVANETLKERDARAEAFRRDKALRLDVSEALFRVLKAPFHGAARYLFYAKYETPSNYGVYYALSMLMLLAIVGIIFIKPLLFAAMAMYTVNTIVYMITERRWKREKSAVRQIASTINAARAFVKKDHPALAKEKLRLEAWLKELRHVRLWLSLFGMDRQGDMDFITEFLKTAFLLDMVSLSAITRGIPRHEEALREIYQLVGEIDAALAVAQMRELASVHCAPAFHDALTVEAKDLAHPLVENPVRNDLAWHSHALITGSNASGKSTFIKAVALNAILAQTLNTCYAASFAMPRARVMSSMAIRDSVINGESYFIAEIKSLKRLIGSIAEDAPLLAFVDEILRGTNTVERVAASSAVLMSLLGRNVLAMAATHDIELTRMLKDAYDNWHFYEEVTEGGISFPYKLSKGPSATRNAIALLEQMGFEKQVVNRARASVAAFERDGKWPNLEA